MASTSTSTSTSSTPTTAENEPKTNGPIVRFIGQNGIPDSLLHTLLFILTAPLQLFNMVAARVNRGSWQNVIYSAFSWWERSAERKVVVEVEQLQQPLRVVLLSDTHNLHKKYGQLEAGDVLIHTGDCTNQGTLKELVDFADWFADQPFDTKILVPGNHDMLLDAPYYQQYYKDWGGKPEWTQEAVDYLKQKGIELVIDRELNVNGLRLFGSPWTEKYAPWRTAFNVEHREMANTWKAIEECDILLTHNAPKGYGDRNIIGKHKGCAHLLEKVIEKKPKVHVFGHNHDDPGIWKEKNCTFINASMVCDFYRVRSPIELTLRPVAS